MRVLMKQSWIQNPRNLNYSIKRCIVAKYNNTLKVLLDLDYAIDYILSNENLSHYEVVFEKIDSIGFSKLKTKKWKSLHHLETRIIFG